MAAAQMGTLTKKIHRQLRCPTISPPSTGPKDRAGQGGQRDHGHQPPQAAPAGRAHQHGLQDRQHQPAAEPLHRAERDERAGVPGQPAEDGTGEEQPERGEPHAPGAVPLDGPARDRHGQGQGQQVPGTDPLHGRHGRVQLAAEGAQRDVDDRAVQ